MMANTLLRDQDAPSRLIGLEYASTILNEMDEMHRLPTEHQSRKELTEWWIVVP